MMAATEQKEVEATPLVYVGMASDIVHHGHVSLVLKAAALGRVCVGLLTNEAIESYKRKPILDWHDRRSVVESICGVDFVIPQRTLDYTPNLKMIRPRYVVHGTDWRTGPQALARQRVIDTLAAWGGELIEPEYTAGISTTDIIRQVAEVETNANARLPVESPPVPAEVNQANKEQLQQLRRELKQQGKIVYVAIATGVIHHGHARVLATARKLGKVVVGLLTDEAVESYRSKRPVIAFSNRQFCYEHLVGVAHVVPQYTLAYADNLNALQPDFVVHGDDWKEGPQQSERAQVITALKRWGGQLVEPQYTNFASEAQKIADTCVERTGMSPAAAQKEPAVATKTDD